MSWPRTLGFATIQITAGLLIQLWCWSVHLRFRYFHPDGVGKGFSNLYWDYSWAYTAFAVLLALVVVVWHLAKRTTLYEVAIYSGYWLLLLWTGFAVCAMEIAFLPEVHAQGEVD